MAENQPATHQPFYKKMWFWGLIVVLILIVIAVAMT